MVCMKVKKEESSNDVFTVLLVIVVLLFVLTYIGCGTIYGLASDAEAGSG